MLGIKAFLEERKQHKKNWETVIQNNQTLLDNYNPDYRYYGMLLQQAALQKLYYTNVLLLKGIFWY